MTAADVVLVASGTASLEAALLRRSMVVTYRVPKLTYRIMWPRRYLPWIGLPNVLAGEYVVPEILQDDATPENLTQALVNQYRDRVVRERQAERGSRRCTRPCDRALQVGRQTPSCRSCGHRPGVKPAVRARTRSRHAVTHSPRDRRLAGVDEAGRGPLAGPVTAACVILDPERPIPGLADSKALSPARRERLADAIRQHALAWSVAEASVDEIGQLNILQATMLAMQPRGRRFADDADRGPRGRQPLPGHRASGPGHRAGRRSGPGDQRGVDPRQDGARCRDADDPSRPSPVRIRPPQGISDDRITSRPCSGTV
jgi:hypothetical protein